MGRKYSTFLKLLKLSLAYSVFPKVSYKNEFSIIFRVGIETQTQRTDVWTQQGKERVG